jgi:putative toxin-antitoxin system antitoxin component (TIGR02293 family)
MSVTSQFMLAGTEEERRSAFMESLSDESVTRTLDDRLGVYSRLLGLRPKKGQVFNLVKLVKTGLPLSAGEKLAEHMGMEAKDFLILYVGMSDSTVRRRFKSHQPLSTDESDRVVRYAHLLCLATNLMSGNEQAAREWLSSPAHALGGSTPLETAVTEAGARRVEDLVVALEHGMFS